MLDRRHARELRRPLVDHAALADRRAENGTLLADAHRAAWAAAGLTVEGIRALPDGPARRAIEAETDRRDEPAYAALSPEERLELLAGLGALPG